MGTRDASGSPRRRVAGAHDASAPAARKKLEGLLLQQVRAACDCVWGCGALALPCPPSSLAHRVRPGRRRRPRPFHTGASLKEVTRHPSTVHVMLDSWASARAGAVTSRVPAGPGLVSEHVVKQRPQPADLRAEISCFPARRKRGASEGSPQEWVRRIEQARVRTPPAHYTHAQQAHTAPQPRARRILNLIHPPGTAQAPRGSRRRR